MSHEIIKNSKTSRVYKALYVIIIIAALNITLHLVFASFTKNGEVSIVSHRGAAAIAPENTLAGVRAGVGAGAPYIEVDIRATKDGALVLMHDSTVDRTTDGSGKVGDLSWDYVSRLDAGAWFGREFSTESVPRLDSILEYMKGKSSKLVIEVKSPGRYPGMETLLSEALRHYGMEKDVVVISFDGGWIERAGRLLPGAALGVLYVYPFAGPAASEVEYVSVFWPSLVIDPTLVWRLKANGLKVWAWNVDSSLLAKFLVWKGVDGLTLDRPGLIGRN
jgi:glycerophosphoryl diester phosphodiesterase